MPEHGPGRAFPPTLTAVSSGSLACDDPCVTEQITEPWDVAITPLSGGPYWHELSFFATPGVVLYREQFSTPTLVRGLSPPGMLVVLVPLVMGRYSNFWKSPLHERGLPAMMPGGVHAEFSAGQQHLMALIKLDIFRTHLPEDVVAAIEAANRQHLLPASGAAVNTLGRTLKGMLYRTRLDPSMLQHPNAMRAFEDDLLCALRRSLSLSLASPRSVGRAVRQRGLHRAIEYLRATPPGAVSVPELCKVALVTQRTLEYAFQETLGLSPKRLIQLRRFHAARRALLAATREDATVRQIAQDNGFYELGRFAVGYKQLFGESPSNALKQPPRELPGRLPRFFDSLRP